MATARALLDGYVRSWLEEIAKLRYAELARRQAPPFATLGYGAAGIAYTLLRAGQTLEEPAWIECAETWARKALHHARTPRGSQTPFERRSSAHSILHGARGVQAVRVLVAQALGEPRRTRARIGEYVRAFSSSASHVLADVGLGRAGQLGAALTLFEATRDERLLALSMRQARALLGAKARSLPAWTRWDNLGFAHGRAGVLHALLRYRRVTGSALPDWIDDQLREVATLAARYSRLLHTSPATRVVAKSWCNGSAGMTLLFSEAFEQTGRVRYLRAAQVGLRTSLEHTEQETGDLCCGLAGEAYAALALERIAPGEGLREHAAALTLRAIELAVRTTRWPHSLLKGFPGSVCLALDLAYDRRPLGFPLLEG